LEARTAAFFTTIRLTWREFLQEGKGALSKTMSYLSIVSSATVKISATSLVKGSHPGGWSRKWEGRPYLPFSSCKAAPEFDLSFRHA